MANEASVTVPGEKPKVCDPSVVVRNMQKDWDLVDCLLGGTRAMREAGKTYLPQRPMERDDDYLNRKNGSTLLPAFSETSIKLTGRVFAEPMELNDDIPKWIIDEVNPNVDMQGRNLSVFSRDWFHMSMNKGHSIVLVESPNKPEVRTQAEQTAANMRPYTIMIDPSRIMGWRQDQDGKLIQLRIKFKRVEDDGEFGTREVVQIRVYEPGKCTTYEEVMTNGSPSGQWAAIGAPVVMGITDEIPVVFFYTNRTGFLQSKPPLLELANLNAKHWRQQSGLDDLVDTAMVPILVAYGGDPDKTLVIGAKAAVTMGKDDNLAYTEHTGAAIKTGTEALHELKQQMREAGGKLLAPGSGRAGGGMMGTKTATQSSEEAASENSALSSMVQDFTVAMSDLLDMIAKWRKETDGGTVELQPNLDPDMNPVDSLTFLLGCASAGKLSDQTLYEETQKRGFVNNELSWEDEQQRRLSQPDLMPPNKPVPGAPGATGAPAPAPTPAPTKPPKGKPKP